uniref:Integrase catalytic domain-containing protein n=1 Tax=Arundo donax TaxID=35708 RepID=A0A0A9BGZ9_ARUDO
MVTDRDRVFTGGLWQSFFKAINVSLRLSSAYHPQSDGQTERVNQCMESYLHCMAFSEPRRWYYWLPLAEWWYNTNYHSSLKTTPFQALYGYPPPMIGEVAVPGPESPAKDFIAEKQHMLTGLKYNLSQAQARMKKYADRNRSERSFNVGDFIYLKMQPYHQVAFGLRGSLKLATKFYGPFMILEKI